MSHPIIFATGSTVCDIVFGNQNIRSLGDVKDEATFSYFATGGGGANFTLALKALKAYHHGGLQIFLGTRLGMTPQNLSRSEHGLQRIAREIIHEELQGIQIIDAIYDQEFRIPVNNPNIANGMRHIYTTFAKAATCITDGMEDEFRQHAGRANLVFLHTRLPHITKVSAEAAQEAGVPIMIDYSVEDPERATVCLEEVLQKSTYVFAPGEARLKGMPKFDKENGDAVRANAQALAARFVEMGLKNFAISNGKEPVIGLSNGQPFNVPVRPISNAIDKLGVGDARNAFAADELIDQMRRGGNPHALDFQRAVVGSSEFATFVIQYPGREWSEDLGRFFTTLYPFRRELTAGEGGQHMHLT